MIWPEAVTILSGWVGCGCIPLPLCPFREPIVALDCVSSLESPFILPGPPTLAETLTEFYSVLLSTLLLDPSILFSGFLIIELETLNVSSLI
jgi:hypothetical protein